MQTSKGIRKFVQNHKVRQYWILAVVLLSLIVATAVVTSLIKPGIAITNEGINTTAVADGDKVVLDPSDVTKVSFVYADGQEDELNSKKVTFTLEYTVGKGLLNKDRKTIVYQLPDSIDIPYDFSQGNHDIYDGSSVAGTFVIDTNGYVTIVCNDDYIEKKQTELDTTGATGTLEFDAVINRDEDKNGNVNIDFGDGYEGPDVEIEFKDRTLEVYKAGELKSDGLVEWTITVKNPEGHDLGGYVISDDMFERAAEFTSAYGTYDESTKQFTFNNGVDNKKIEIKYSTPITTDDVFDNDSKLLNDVTITPDNPEDDKTVSDEASVDISSAFDIGKSGTANYDDLKNPSVDWKITLSNPFGLSLKDMVIQDNAFKNLSKDEITLPDGVEFTVDNSTGTLTITNDVKNTSLDITYSYDKDNDGKDITADSYVYNEVYIKYPDEDKKFDSSNTSVKYNAYNFGKNSSIDSSNDLITWTIYVQGDGVKDLDGLKITDEMFKDKVGDITVKKQWSDESQIDWTYDGDNTITINSTEYDAIEITFKTTASDHVNSDGKVVNKAQLIGDETVIKEATKEEKYNPENKLNKTSGNVKEIDGNEDLLEVNYSFTVIQDLKIMPQTITDTLTTTDENALHYISKKQAENLVVNGKKKGVGENFGQLDKSLYTIKFYDNDNNLIDFEADADAKAVKFEVILSDTIDDDAENLYCQIKVEYKATIDATSELVKAGETYKYTNIAKSTETDVDDDNAKTEISKKKIDYTDVPYQKIDSVKKLEQSEIFNSDLEIVKIEGVDNYVIGWYVQLNDNGDYNGKSGLEFTDTLPKGFTLYGDIKQYFTSLDDVLNGNFGYSSGNLSTNWDSWGDKYKVETNNGVSTIKFKFDSQISQVRTLYYEATIPYDVLNQMLKNSNGKIEIVNTFDDNNEKYAPVKQTETIGQNALNKDSILSSNGYKNYKIEVNPGADSLSSSDWITLKDLFITRTTESDGKKFYCYDKGAVNVELTEIKVYEISETGTKTELAPTQYSYTLNNTPELKTVTYTYDEFTKSDSETFTQSDVQVIKGTPITVKFKNFTITDNYNCGFDYWINGENKWYSLSENSFQLDKDRNPIVTLDVDKDYDVGEFKVKLYGATAENVEVSFDHEEHEFAAELLLEVPDEKHLVIEYTYYCEPNQYSGDKVGVVNSVETQSQLGAVSSMVGDTLVLTGNSGGTITTEKYLSIDKVDVGSFTTKLEAEFELWYYDVNNSKWLPATKFTSNEDKPYLSVTWGSDKDTPVTFKTLTTKDSFSIFVSKNTLFKLVETKAPTGYIKNTEPIYFAYGSIPTTMPDGVVSGNVTLVLEGGTLDITNYKSTDISVLKSWDNGNTNHIDDNVFVQLYYSTKKVTNGFPDDAYMTTYGSEIKLDAENNWSYTWKDLPTGNDKGQAYYYYVKETKYSVDGTTYNVGEGEYSTYYTGNAVNTSDGTPIKILNSIGLQVNKVWVDKNNKTMNPMLDSIQFKLYKSKLSPDNLNGYNFPTDAVEVTYGGLDTFILSKDNDWTMLFTNLEQQDSEGNTYYYYVKEVTTSDDFHTLYIGNGKGTTGEMTIRNKSYTEVDTGAVLPLTGGHGTTLYYCIGLAIIATVIFAGFMKIKKIRKGV